MGKRNNFNTKHHNLKKMINKVVYGDNKTITKTQYNYFVDFVNKFDSSYSLSTPAKYNSEIEASLVYIDSYNNDTTENKRIYFKKEYANAYTVESSNTLYNYPCAINIFDEQNNKHTLNYSVNAYPFPYEYTFLGSNKIDVYPYNPTYLYIKDRKKNGIINIVKSKNVYIPEGEIYKYPISAYKGKVNQNAKTAKKMVLDKNFTGYQISRDFIIHTYSWFNNTYENIQQYDVDGNTHSVNTYLIYPQSNYTYNTNNKPYTKEQITSMFSIKRCHAGSRGGKKEERINKYIEKLVRKGIIIPAGKDVYSVSKDMYKTKNTDYAYISGDDNMTSKFKIGYCMFDYNDIRTDNCENTSLLNNTGQCNVIPIYSVGSGKFNIITKPRKSARYDILRNIYTLNAHTISAKVDGDFVIDNIKENYKAISKGSINTKVSLYSPSLFLKYGEENIVRYSYEFDSTTEKEQYENEFVVNELSQYSTIHKLDGRSNVVQLKEPYVTVNSCEWKIESDNLFINFRPIIDTTYGLSDIRIMNSSQLAFNAEFNAVVKPEITTYEVHTVGNIIEKVKNPSTVDTLCYTTSSYVDEDGNTVTTCYTYIIVPNNTGKNYTTYISDCLINTYNDVFKLYPNNINALEPITSSYYTVTSYAFVDSNVIETIEYSNDKIESTDGVMNFNGTLPDNRILSNITYYSYNDFLIPISSIDYSYAYISDTKSAFISKVVNYNHVPTNTKLNNVILLGSHEIGRNNGEDIVNDNNIITIDKDIVKYKDGKGNLTRIWVAIEDKGKNKYELVTDKTSFINAIRNAVALCVTTNETQYKNLTFDKFTINQMPTLATPTAEYPNTIDALLSKWDTKYIWYLVNDGNKLTVINFKQEKPQTEVTDLYYFTDTRTPICPIINGIRQAVAGGTTISDAGVNYIDSLIITDDNNKTIFYKPLLDDEGTEPVTNDNFYSSGLKLEVKESQSVNYIYTANDNKVTPTKFIYQYTQNKNGLKASDPVIKYFDTDTVYNTVLKTISPATTYLYECFGMNEDKVKQLINNNGVVTWKTLDGETEVKHTVYCPKSKIKNTLDDKYVFYTNTYTMVCDKYNQYSISVDIKDGDNQLYTIEHTNSKITTTLNTEIAQNYFDIPIEWNIENDTEETETDSVLTEEVVEQINE